MTAWLAPRPADQTWAVKPGDEVTLLTVYVVLLLAIPSRLSFAPLGGGGTPAAVLGSALLVIWLASSVLASGSETAGGANQTRPVRAVRPVRVALCLLSLALLTSYVVATTRPIGAGELRSADRGLIGLTALLGVALVTAEGPRDLRRLDVLLRRLVLGTAGLGLVGILEYFTGLDLARHVVLPGLTATGELGGIGERSVLRRVAGTAIHPIEFGVVLATVLPLALHYALHARPGERLRPWLAVVVIAVAIPMSVSRSAFVGFAAAALILLAGWSRRRRLWFLLCTPVFFVVMRVLAPGLIGTIRSLFLNLGSDASTSGRTSDYAAVGHYVATAPWFGRGFMTFTPVEYRLLDNEYLKLLVETGLVGLVAVLAVFLAAVGTALVARSSSTDADARDLALSLAACVAVPFVAFATFDALSFPLISGLTFLLIGACGAVWQLRGAPRDSQVW